MITAREYSNLVLLDLVDEPMLLIDAARPTALRFVPQRLGFSYAGKRISLNLANQSDDSKRNRPTDPVPPTMRDLRTPLRQIPSFSTTVSIGNPS
jgi:hypothetical protein